MPNLVQFGAGNIGRSLVAPLFTQAGYHVTFVDVQRAVIDALNARGGYRVIIKDEIRAGQPDTVNVSNVSGLHADDRDAIGRAVAAADLIGTAVGERALPAVIRSMADGLIRRDCDVTVLCCENTPDAAAMASAALAAAPLAGALRVQVRFARTSIGKMVPIMPPEAVERDPLEVWAEAYSTIIADADAFADPKPSVPGLELHGCFQAYVDRKLYVHNLGHATAAYFGYLNDKTHIYECVNDPAIERATRRAMTETGRALVSRFSGEFSARSMLDHVNDLLRRFGNRHLKDTVFRVGRDLQRKLSPGDRMIGGIKLVIDEGGDPREIASAIAAATFFGARHAKSPDYASDNAFRRQLDGDGLRRYLMENSGMDTPAYGAWVANIVAERDRLSYSENAAGRSPGNLDAVEPLKQGGGE